MMPELPATSRRWLMAWWCCGIPDTTLAGWQHMPMSNVRLGMKVRGLILVIIVVVLIIMSMHDF
jgi:hypothetical protein